MAQIIIGAVAGILLGLIFGFVAIYFMFKDTGYRG